MDEVHVWYSQVGVPKPQNERTYNEEPRVYTFLKYYIS